MATPKDIEVRFVFPEYRQCIVDGKKALFHRWVEKEDLLISFDCYLKFDQMENIAKDFIKKGILPNGSSTKNVKNLVALVEFEDGTMAEVGALSIQFLDSYWKFNEMVW